MSQKIRAVLALVLLSAGAAQAQAPMNCTGLDPNSAPDSIRAFDCIGGLDSDIKIAMEMIETLRDQVSALQAQIGASAPLPAGTVAAIDSPEGCPTGWSPFVQAQGRAIFGATFGRDDQLASTPPPQHKYRDHGGAAEVTLTERQMPVHAHGTIVHNAGNDDRGFGSSDESAEKPLIKIRGDNATGRFSFATSTAGGNQPHSNMPPYIALYFCKKDAT